MVFNNVIQNKRAGIKAKNDGSETVAYYFVPIAHKETESVSVLKGLKFDH